MYIEKFGRKFKVRQWIKANIGNIIAVDTETNLIKSPDHVPDLVITCAYSGTDTVYLITNKMLPDFLNTHKLSRLIFHNFDFDQRVITKNCDYTWWDLIENDQIIDTELLFKLVNIATKGYSLRKSSLDFCITNRLKDVLPKDNSIRLTFGQFINEDLSVNYQALIKSKKHIKYAVLDPIATYLLYRNLMKDINTLPTKTILAHKIHLMGYLGLKDIHRNGIGVDLEYTDNLRDTFNNEIKPCLKILADYGYVVGLKGNQKTYDNIIDFLNIPLPRCEDGTYSMKEEDLTKYSHIPFIDAMIKYHDSKKKLDFLKELTSSRIHPYYDSIKNTGRTGCSKPNMQNPPVKGGIRECFIPANGCIFGDADYSSIEMFTAAYYMKMKDMGGTMYDILNAGIDPHIYVASITHNVPMDSISKKDVRRQRAKPANYGFLANMSPRTFRTYAKQYGLDLSLKEATAIKSSWVSAYPEVDTFWKSANGKSTFVSSSGFIRANCTYTSWLNTHFQGLAAEGAKIALYMCYKAGLKMVSFVHDQIVIESPINKAKEELKKLEKCMIDGMKCVCDMNIQVEGELKERYSK